MTIPLGRLSRYAREPKSRCLFHWRPDENPLVALTGQDAVFTRASAARGVATNGVIYTAAEGMPRLAYTGAQSLLLEGQRTNALTRSEELGNAAYTPSDTTVTSNDARAPDGALTADKIVEAAVTDFHYIDRTSGTFTADTDQAGSCYVKAGGRTRGYFYLLTGTGECGVIFNLTAETATAHTTGAGSVAGVGIEAIGNDWYRVWFVGKPNAADTSGTLRLLLADATGATSYAGSTSMGMYSWGWQHEVDAGFVSSYIPTVGTTVTRIADALSFPFAALPQTMTAYVRFRSIGALAGDLRLLQVGNAAGAAPYWTIFHVAANGLIASGFTDGTETVTSTAADGAAYGEVVEVVSVLGENGFTIRTYLSINEGAVLSASEDSEANRLLPAAFAGEFLYINSVGASNVGFAEYRAVKIAAGVRTLAQMRSLF
jgi:hypothetical protein